MIRLFTILSLVCFLASTAHAQDGTNSLRTFKRGTAIVLFAGVGGGILGLSTLSFYGEPQEHTTNITTGALLGLAAGLGYVIWEANAPSERPASAYVTTDRYGQPALAFVARF